MKTLDTPLAMPPRSHQPIGKRPGLSRPEIALLIALGLALLAALVGPAVAQPTHYHAFADQRTWLGLPHAMDVLSNLPFAFAGAWGLLAARRIGQGPQGMLNDGHRSHGNQAHLGQHLLAKLFFWGLIVTAICSSIYHLQPDNQRLALDRLGMVVAFAGLLGLA